MTLVLPRHDIIGPRRELICPDRPRFFFPMSSRRRGGIRPYKPGAIVFDGINDYMARGGDLTGAADGKAATISFWINFAALGNQYIFINGNARWLIDFDNAGGGYDDKFRIFGRNTGGGTILNMLSNTALTTGTWYHVLTAFNLAATTGYLYINNVDDKAAGATLTDDTIDKTGGAFRVGADDVGANKTNASVADFWYSDTFLDISSAAVRAKFILGGKAVNLGPTGTAPGATPIAFFKHTTGAAATDFATNVGTGGDMSITGTLTETTGPNG